MSKEMSLSQAVRQVGRRNENTIKFDAAIDPKGEDTFMGIGLLSREKLSKGLGMGVLPMLCVAKQVANLSGANTHILVADLHALDACNRAFSETQVSDVADEVALQLSTALRMLGCDSKVFRASQHPDFNFKAIDYVLRQAEDVLTAQQKLGVGLKIGWQSKREDVKDEVFFDNQAVNLHPELQDMSFMRTGEGVSLQMRSGIHLNIPPYFGEQGGTLGEEIVIKNLAEENRQMNNYLSAIGRMLVTTFGSKNTDRRPQSLTFLQEFIDGLRKN
ncbi:MAG: hypothetical protein A3J60_00320 [Candidatus Pacebacteria bacterium RIFCSPHIGHO2_02_FULL_46_9]|nr:MAG: hypothetical protein A3J60_00320 [Candidatus Pacebacteria bacterium RIFCSPHIGHO2_02_FULL_46_9]